MRTVLEKIYYPNYQNGGRELQLPNDPKSYFESSCYEWESATIEEKLLDLGYLVTHGFDLQNYVEEYIAEHRQNELYVLSALVQLISYLRAGENGDYGILLLQRDDEISISEAVDLLCKEVKLRYEQRYVNSNGSFMPSVEQQLKNLPEWDYSLLAELKMTKEVYYNVFKMPTDEYQRRINTI